MEGHAEGGGVGKQKVDFADSTESSTGSNASDVYREVFFCQGAANPLTTRR